MILFQLTLSALFFALAVLNFTYYYNRRLWISALACSVAITVSLLTALWAGHDIKKRRNP